MNESDDFFGVANHRKDAGRMQTGKGAPILLPCSTDGKAFGMSDVLLLEQRTTPKNLVKLVLLASQRLAFPLRGTE